MAGIFSSIERYLAPTGSLVAQKLRLAHFEPHFSVFVLCFLGFSLLHPLSTYVISPKLFPNAYKSLGKRSRYNWDTHVVSMVHASIAGPWALYLSTRPMPQSDYDRAFAWDDRGGPLYAFSMAYFLWDTLESLYVFSDIGFVVHGASCLLIYTFGYTPFMAAYGPRALSWELSTPFLNIHWFLDKANKTGSTFQLINGVTLLVVFFGVRIVYGAYVTFLFLRTLHAVRSQVPLFVAIVFAGGNMALNVLNWIWFSKMIAALKRRFPSSTSSPSAPNPTADETLTKEASEIPVKREHKLSIASPNRAYRSKVD